jgi:hypothetical protein
MKEVLIQEGIGSQSELHTGGELESSPTTSIQAQAKVSSLFAASLKSCPFAKPSRRKCRNCLERGHPAVECRYQIWFHRPVWTVDRLQRQGWPNFGLSKLCNQVQESSMHLLLHCRFSWRIWIGLKDCLGLIDFAPSPTIGLRLTC